MSGDRDVVLGPLFTLGVALGVYGLVRRRRGALALGALAVAANWTPVGRGLADRVRGGLS